MKSAGLALLAAMLLPGAEPEDSRIRVQDVEKLELRVHGAELQLTLTLRFTASTSVEVSKLSLLNCHLDAVKVVTEPYLRALEITPRINGSQTLVFNAPLTPSLAPLAAQSGKRIKLKSTLVIDGVAKGSALSRVLSRPRTVSWQTPLEGEPVLAELDTPTLEALKPPAAQVEPATQPPAPAVESARTPRFPLDFAGRLVLIESSYSVSGDLTVYSPGLRVSASEIVAPLALTEPWKIALRKLSVASMVGKLNISGVNPAEVRIRAWTLPADGARLTPNEATGFPLKLKQRLCAAVPHGEELAVFELAGAPPRQLPPLGFLAAAGQPGADGVFHLRLDGYSDTGVTAVSLALEPVSGSLAGGEFTFTSPLPRAVSGSAIVSREGLVGIVTGERGALSGAEVLRALRDPGACGSGEAPVPTGRVVKGNIVTYPPNAWIELDGQALKDTEGRVLMTPVSIPIRTGKHELRLHLDRYRRKDVKFEVTDDFEITFRMVPDNGN